eukprot:COSAG01_NODE_5527_length_4205_cov_2.387725_6_plen_71_part_00
MRCRPSLLRPSYVCIKAGVSRLQHTLACGGCTHDGLDNGPVCLDAVATGTVLLRGRRDVVVHMPGNGLPL